MLIRIRILQHGTAFECDTKRLNHRAREKDSSGRCFRWFGIKVPSSDYHEAYRRQFDLDVRLIEEYLIRLEDYCVVLNTFLIDVENNLLKEKLNNTFTMVWNLYSTLQILFEDRPTNIQYPEYVTPTIRNNGVDRPKIGITAEQISLLRNMGSSWTAVSHVLGVSRRTLFRYRETFHLTELFVTEQFLTANTGEVYVLGALRARGCNVARWRVRDCFSELDAVGREMRRRKAVVRRVYRVKGANYLW
ncbi:hypothetical protein ABEB36_014494 [Hypothenemus hampei]|uniref:Resolvase HTH domain-containing protein n=1 Tax=Hypothenemus hampei TaxID=57062 RepID=A0ABD1E2W9_HYPHA